ncbi:glycosyltransferase [Acetobacteraceae bacterium]|nr:glycosyltransferase [Candidatus Parcubacteria bacterium]
MEKPKFLLIIPAHNEADIIEAAVGRVWGVLRHFSHIQCRLAVIDNASTDGTGQKVTALNIPEVSVLYAPMRGKGAAILYGAREGEESDFFGFIDADLSADPESIPKLLDSVFKKESDIAIGSRLLDKQTVARSFLRTFSSECFNVLRRLLINTPVRDSQCGLKLMNERGREVLRHCEETGWFLDMEFLARASRASLTIKEFPVEWDEYRFPDRKSKLSVLRDGILAVIAMVRIRRRLRQ